MNEVITQQSDPGRYAALYRQWKLEHEPGWLVVGSRSYQVFRLSGEQIEFREVDNRSMYESTSF